MKPTNDLLKKSESISNAIQKKYRDYESITDF